ncbi:molybdopterin converting factor subunit 1 [Limnohabitans sp. 2KL-1]|jgi:molybdopterin synthase sulfur carrier subunit|uniref:molybdopterin converting factor subunit 1 n=1 Tax=Limnohabitans sp. 2KL-1 TaxID=1100699 RepID=UPI000D33A598|nr:molybdopterin converting factor subunit 1 [Limnohabitans sp. 2KL-1]PUE47019.1 molybdopterin converting factor subunit 1 [Limnohabitans sp. 2KL-1]
MKVQVRYFASLRESIGLSHETVETQVSDLLALRGELMGRGAHYRDCLAPERPVRMALNQQMVQDNAPLTEGCEVGFFPPVTGG